MGKIGQFIDRCVESEPELMRRVHDRPWGTLAHFVDFDSEDEACGCLVGSIGIEAGAKVFGIDRYQDAWSVIEAADVVSGDEDANDIGGDVYEQLCARVAGQVWSVRDGIETSDPLPQDAELRTIAMLKARIARRLRERDGRAFVRSIAGINPTFDRRVALARTETQ